MCISFPSLNLTTGDTHYSLPNYTAPTTPPLRKPNLQLVSERMNGAI
jgi:hypothetical protein